uniref:Uncharacterized protein n=1 Tax=Equus caballus TaxID=9796 RepID=A0A9L0QZ72_HORSE
MIKRSILQEYVILNMHAPNIKASNCRRQKLIELQGELYEFTILIAEVNTPLSKMNRSSRQKINKDIVELNTTISQLDVIDTYGLFYPNGRIHISLKLTWNIHQDRSHSGP